MIISSLFGSFVLYKQHLYVFFSLLIVHFLWLTYKWYFQYGIFSHRVSFQIFKWNVLVFVSSVDFFVNISLNQYIFIPIWNVFIFFFCSFVCLFVRTEFCVHFKFYTFAAYRSISSYHTSKSLIIRVFGITIIATLLFCFDSKIFQSTVSTHPKICFALIRDSDSIEGFFDVHNRKPDIIICCIWLTVCYW